LSLKSTLYVGSVMHRRLRPRAHDFRYRAFWLLLDLDELAALSDRLRWFSYNRANLFSLRDSDHGDGSATPLRQQVHATLAAADIALPGGRIRLLCMPRTLGHCFNPLSLYFCHRQDGRLAAMIYQVHNTFGERHSYVVPVEGNSGVLRQTCGKLLRVSPFLNMDLHYEFRVSGPDERLTVGICTRDGKGPLLSAVLTATRAPLTDRGLLRIFLRIPAVTLKVIAAIHWEALRLWLKGVRPTPAATAATTPAPATRS
jgi:DUF1365 family protein